MNVRATDSHENECAQSREKHMIVIMCGARQQDCNANKKRPAKSGPVRFDCLYSWRQTQVMCGTITVPLGRYSCTYEALQTRTAFGPG